QSRIAALNNLNAQARKTIERLSRLNEKLKEEKLKTQQKGGDDGGAATALRNQVKGAHALFQNERNKVDKLENLFQKAESKNKELQLKLNEEFKLRKKLEAKLKKLNRSD